MSPLDVQRAGSRELAGLYDARYFACDCGRPYQRDESWLSFFGGIADRIVRDVQPRTVLDVGCAMGFLVESLRDRGVECYGLDISDYALERVRTDIRPYCRMGSVTEPLPRQYDLIVCIEVFEHLAPQEADQAAANLCQHTDDILFSSTPYDYKEALHLNVQPPEHWAEVFARHGFFHDIEFDASFLAAWGVRFRRRQEPIPRLIREYERKQWLLQRENADLRASVLEARSQAVAADRRLAELGDQISSLEQLGQAVAEREAEVARLKGFVADQGQGLVALQAELAGLDRLAGSLAAREQEIAHLQGLVAGYEHGLAAVQAQARLDALGQTLAEREQENARLATQVAAYERGLFIRFMRHLRTFLGRL